MFSKFWHAVVSLNPVCSHQKSFLAQSVSRLAEKDCNKTEPISQQQNRNRRLLNSSLSSSFRKSGRLFYNLPPLAGSVIVTIVLLALPFFGSSPLGRGQGTSFSSHLKKTPVPVFVIIMLLLASTAFAADFDRLLDAIEQVESGGRVCTGDGGNAVGSYQIWKIYVDDVNRIIGKNRYSYADRYSRVRSRQMVRIYLNHYGKGKSFEAMARIHNGGPKGDTKQSTVKYWEKVKEAMGGAK